MMSRGPGSVESQLIGILLKNKKPLLSTDELCRKVFRLRANEVEKKHRVSVLRVLKRLSKRSTLNVWRAVLKGRRDDLWFDYDRAKPGFRTSKEMAPAHAPRPRKK
jgi:hypothetical protein